MMDETIAEIEEICSIERTARPQKEDEASAHQEKSMHRRPPRDRGENWQRQDGNRSIGDR